MSSPADELKAAADKLHSLITFLGDNRGPWKVGTPPSGYPQSISNVGVPYCVADTHEDPSIPVFTIAPYIATMHPGVGKANASLLEAAAGFVDDYPDLTRPHVDDEPCSDHACRIVHAALAVARAINTGGQP